MYNQRHFPEIDAESYHDDHSAMAMVQGQNGGLRPSHMALSLRNDIHAIEQRNEFLESRNDMLTGMLMQSKRAMLERSLNGNKATLLKEAFKAWRGCLEGLKMERLLEDKTLENSELNKAARDLAHALNAEREGRKQTDNACWQLQDDCKRLAMELQLTRQRSDEQSQRIKVLEVCMKEAESFISRRRQEVMDVAQEHDTFVDALRQKKKQLERQDRDNMSDGGAPNNRPSLGVDAQNILKKEMNRNGRADAARRQPSPELERPITGLPSSPMPVMGGIPPMTPNQEPSWLRDTSMERSRPQGRLNWHQNSLEHATSPSTGVPASRSYETNSYMREVPPHLLKLPASPIAPAPLILQPAMRIGSPLMPVRTGDSKLIVGLPTTIPSGESWWAMQRRAASPIPGSTL